MRSASLVPSFLNPFELRNDYHLFFATLGFERRARHIAEVLHPQAAVSVAMGFPDRQVLNYAENRQWFNDHGFQVLDDLDEKKFTCQLRELFANATADDVLRACVDISSMTRSRMASIVELCCSGAVPNGSVIDFAYSLGAYSPPPLEMGPNTFFGPISSAFAGWTLDPNKPPVAVIGLGYEEGKALGASEYIQADEAWAFVPESPIAEYSPAVREANRTFLQYLPERQQIVYRPDDPVDCYVRLESLLYGLVAYSRPIILPFGPKMFSLVALLASTRHQEVSVWRVSAQEQDSPSDRLPSEHIIAMRVTVNTLESSE